MRFQLVVYTQSTNEGNVSCTVFILSNENVCIDFFGFSCMHIISYLLAEEPLQALASIYYQRSYVARWDSVLTISWDFRSFSTSFQFVFISVNYRYILTLADIRIRAVNVYVAMCPKYISIVLLLWKFAVVINPRPQNKRHTPTKSLILNDEANAMICICNLNLKRLRVLQSAMFGPTV